MMRRLAATSIRYRVLALALVAAVMVLGFAQLRTMSRDVLPEFDEPTVDVQTEALGLSSAEVEQLVTVPLEQDLLNGVPFVDKIESKSLPGLSWIHIVFEHGTPVYRARQVVTERMTQAAGIPAVAKPPQMIQPVSSTSRLLLIGLSSPKVSLIDMGVLARWTIRPRLLGVPGVANVSIWGQRERQLQVQVDPQRLAAAGVTLDQVISTTGNALWWSPLGRLEANTPGTGGFFDGPTQRLGLFHESPIKKPGDLARVPIEAAEGAGGSGSELRLGDIANVVNDHQPLIGDSVLRSGSGLMLVVEKLPGANTIEVTHRVNEALDELAPGLRGITLDRSMFRPATYVEESGNNAATALLIGLGLAVLLLLLVFFDWRIALIGAIAVAASELTAALVLGLRGETLNTMLIAGLGVAMAILVADVVTDVVNVRRYLHGGATDPAERGALIGDALAETRRPLAYATVVILLALVPVAVLHGESGAFLPSIALSYAAAIVASALVALVATPALSSLLLAGGRDPSAAPLVRRLHAGFAAWSRRGFGGMRVAVVAAVGLVVVGLVALPFLDHERSLVPSFRDPNVLVRWNGAPGTSITEMDRISARVLRELRAVGGVRDAGGHVGRAVLGDQVVGSNAGELWVTLDDGADYDATLAAIRSTVRGYPGIDHAVTSYPSQRVADILHRPRHDLTVRIYGANGVTTRAKAQEIRSAIAKVPGVAAPAVHLAPTEPTIRVEVNLDAAQRAGVKPGDVRRASAALLSGLGVGALFQDQKVFDVVVWGTPSIRRDLDSVRNLLIETPESGTVRLADLATVRVAPALSVIEHEDVSRFVDVTAEVKGRDVADVAADVRTRIDRVRFPLEHHAVVLGDYSSRRGESTRFFGILAAVVIGCFLLFQAAFASWRLATVALFVAPLALSGGVLAAAVAGVPWSLGVIAGLFVVGGMAIRECCVLLHRCQEIAQGDLSLEAHDVVQRSVGERLVPVLTAAVAGVLVAAPALLAGSVAGLEVLHPAAIVMLGGMVTAAVVNLVVVPAFAARLGPRPTSHTTLDLAALESEVAPRRRDPPDRRGRNGGRTGQGRLR